MKITFLVLLVLIFATAACGVPQTSTTPNSPEILPTDTGENIATVAPTEATVEVTEIPTATSTEQVPTSEGVKVFYGPVSLVLPDGLASGISGSTIPSADGEDVAPWGVTPGHTQIELTGYLLQGKLHQPRIYVYPAQEYAEKLPAAFENIRRLDNILYSPDAPKLGESLPTITFFSAAQVFASNIEAISFQNGSGVRFLTEYAQYAAPINNHELFYHFQGVTRDGTYYIIAVIPITSKMLAETSEPGAVLPSDGVAFPGINDPNADFQSYYSAVSEMLDNATPETFSPLISQLDELIQSLQITP